MSQLAELLERNKAMTERKIEVEADSLEEARKQVRAQIPHGFVLWSEKAKASGTPDVMEYADTVEEAFAKAQAKLPANAEILGISKHDPELEHTIAIEALDEEGARVAAQSWLAGKSLYRRSIKDIRVAIAGSKGFLGFGGTPTRYEVDILKQAFVSVKYRSRPKISAWILPWWAMWLSIPETQRQKRLPELRSQCEEQFTSLREDLLSIAGFGLDLLAVSKKADLISRLALFLKVIGPYLTYEYIVISVTNEHESPLHEDFEGREGKTHKEASYPEAGYCLSGKPKDEGVRKGENTRMENGTRIKDTRFLRGDPAVWLCKSGHLLCVETDSQREYWTDNRYMARYTYQWTSKQSLLDLQDFVSPRFNYREAAIRCCTDLLGILEILCVQDDLELKAIKDRMRAVRN